MIQMGSTVIGSFVFENKVLHITKLELGDGSGPKHKLSNIHTDFDISMFSTERLRDLICHLHRRLEHYSQLCEIALDLCYQELSTRIGT